MGRTLFVVCILFLVNAGRGGAQKMPPQCEMCLSQCRRPPCNCPKECEGYSSQSSNQGIHGSMSESMLHDMLEMLPGALRARLELTGILPNIETMSQLHYKEILLLPESIIKRLNSNLLADLNATDVMKLLQLTQGKAESILHIFTHLSQDLFRRTLSQVKQEEVSCANTPKSIFITVISAIEHHFGRPRNWRPEIIQLLDPFKTGLNAEQIKMLSKEAFEALLASFTRNQTNDPCKFERSERRAILIAGMRHWGRVSYWNKDKLLSVGPIMMDMTPNELKMISPSIMMEILPIVGQYQFEHNRGRVVINVVTRSPDWNWSSLQVKSLGNLSGFLHGKEIQKLPAETITAASSELVKSVRGRGSQVRNIASKITEALGDVRNWNKDNVKTLGRAASGLKVKDLEELPASALVESVADIAKSDFSRRQRQVVLKKFKEGRQNAKQPISSTEVKQLGNLVAGLKSSDFRKMDSTDIKESLSTLREAKDKMDKTQKFEIMRKLKRSKGGIGEVVMEMGDLAKEVPLNSLKNVSLLTLLEPSQSSETNDTQEDDVPVVGAGRIKWSKSQSMMMFREVVKKTLAPSGSLEALDAGTIRYMGTLSLGMTCKDIRSLLDDNIISIAGAMMELNRWTDRQLYCLIDKIRNSLSRNFTATFTESDVVQLTGQLLIKLSVRELTEIPAFEREIAYTSIGQEDLTDVKPIKRRQLARRVLKDRGKESEDSEIDSEDLDVLGNMICDLDEGAIDGMSSDAFNNAIYDMHTCCFKEPQRAAVRSRIIKENGNADSWNSEQLTSFGTLMGSLEEEEIDQIDQDEFSTVAEEIMSDFGDFLDKTEECAKELSTEDMDSINEGFKRVAISAKDALVSAAQSSPARKKRETYSPTCNEIEVLGEGNVAWTVEELLAMETVEFDNCAETLGQVESFTAEQLDALLQKAKQTWGEAAEMEPSEIQQLGRIASRFSINDIGNLNLTDNDAVYDIAVHNIWTTEQLSAAFERYHSLSGDDLSAYEASTLVALANFVCGMTPTQIASLDSSSYGEAAAVVGELESCSPNQWAAFKDHSIAEFGPIDSWQPDVYAEVGSLIVGFTAVELGNLDNTTLAGVKASAIGWIPADTFAAGFSAAVLASFDAEQVEAVTELQRAALSDDQLAALDQVEYEIVVTTEIPVSAAVEVASPSDKAALFVTIFIIQAILNVSLRI
ncbi:otoancorin-like isoform X2 [Ptychodera flava]|uniref:otoancorin-like isoform X2 n=1 Tax=Ptychodera flava TaxID=63121 RepID=UPI00396A7E1A